MSFTILDIILLVPLLFGFVRGLFKGLISELSSIVSLIGGLILAFYFTEPVYNFLAERMGREGVEIRAFSFVIIFVIVVIAINLLSKTITKLLDMIALGVLNHILGGAFGLAKWLLIILVAIYFLKELQAEELIFQRETLEASAVYMRLAEYSSLVADLVNALSGQVGEELPDFSPELP